MVTQEQVLSVEGFDNGLTLPEIAEALGMDRPSGALFELVESLVADGVVDYEAGTYYYYKDECCEDAECDVVEVLHGGAASVVYPRSSRNAVITDLGNGRTSVKFSHRPEAIVLEPGNKIIAINAGGTNQKIFQTPNNTDNILSCVRQAVNKYVVDYAIGQYLVTDVHRGETSSIENIDTSPVVIFIDVTRHNKAA